MCELSGKIKAPHCGAFILKSLPRVRSGKAWRRYWFSIPAQRPTRLILNHPRLKEVLLLLEVHDLAHPRERVGGARVLFLQSNLRQAAVGDELEVVLHHGGIHTEHAAGHGVAG